jgi:hypothetical protein
MKLRIYPDDLETHLDVQIESCNEYEIRITEKLNGKRVLLYGTEVGDKRQLDKDAIFTVGISAIKELDSIVQKQQEELVQQKDELVYQKVEIHQLKQQYDYLLQRLTRLEQR